MNEQIELVEYNDPLNFIFDDTQIEIVGALVKLKRMPLQGSELSVFTCKDSVNADRASGLGVMTLTNSNRVLFNGKYYYDLSGGAINVSASILDQPDIAVLNEGCIRFKMVPKYNNAPAPSNSTIFTLVDNLGGSRFYLYHGSNGNFEARYNNSSNTSFNSLLFGAWAPVADTEYEIEINWSLIFGVARLFVNGVQIGEDQVISQTAGLRDKLIFGSSEGGGLVSDFLIRDIQIFNTPQHTIDFINEIPRVIPLYPVCSPIEPIQPITADGLFNLEESGLARYTIKIGTNYYYINNGVITASDQTKLKSNTVEEIVAAVNAITAAIVNGAVIKIVPLLCSNDERDSYHPLTSNTITYNFFAFPLGISSCTVYGYVRDNTTGSKATVKIFSDDNLIIGDSVVLLNEQNLSTDDGYFELEIAIPAPGVKYSYEISGKDKNGKTYTIKGKISIPDQPTALFSSLIS